MKAVLKFIKILFFVVVGFTFVLFLFAQYDNYDSNKTEKELAEQKAKDEACRKELSCWADKTFFTASSACQTQVEKLASYDSEWTDSVLQPKFSHYRWLDKTKGTVTYIGDRIKFQNRYGAWAHFIYECDYDPINKTVLKVRAEQGRL